jgi:hypothetical protein
MQQPVPALAALALAWSSWGRLLGGQSASVCLPGVLRCACDVFFWSSACVHTLDLHWQCWEQPWGLVAAPRVLSGQAPASSWSILRLCRCPRVWSNCPSHARRCT